MTQFFPFDRQAELQITEPRQVTHKRSLYRDAARRFMRNKLAVIGLVVNAVSVFVLGGHHDNHDHDHHEHGADCHHHDHNLRSAYLHVMADALTSVLARLKKR